MWGEKCGGWGGSRSRVRLGLQTTGAVAERRGPWFGAGEAEVSGRGAGASRGGLESFERPLRSFSSPKAPTYAPTAQTAIQRPHLLPLPRPRDRGGSADGTLVRPPARPRRCGGAAAARDGGARGRGRRRREQRRRAAARAANWRGRDNGRRGRRRCRRRRRRRRQRRSAARAAQGAHARALHVDPGGRGRGAEGRRASGRGRCRQQPGAAASIPEAGEPGQRPRRGRAGSRPRAATGPG
jgi:hypothetical protein